MTEKERKEAEEIDVLLISPLEGKFFPKEIVSIESVIRLSTPDNSQIRIFNQSNLDDLDVSKVKESHIIISGSDKSIREQLPFRDKINDVIQMVRDTGKNLLGICWGHQFIAEKLGGEVFVAEKYPDVPLTPEFGAVPLKLTQKGIKDPIFHRIRVKNKKKGWPIVEPRFYMTHIDYVKGLPHKPKRVEILAENDWYPNQVLRIDDHIVTTQMHPELIKIQVMHFIAFARREIISVLEKERYKNELPGWEEAAKKSVIAYYREAEKNGLQFMRNFYHRPKTISQQMMLDFFNKIDYDEGETGFKDESCEHYRQFSASMGFYDVPQSLSKQNMLPFDRFLKTYSLPEMRPKCADNENGFNIEAYQRLLDMSMDTKPDEE